MKKLGVIMVGIDGWKEFTLPAIQSIRIWLPNAELVVVDAASKTPYPLPPYGSVLRLDASPSYAFAINKGVEALADCDWFLILNNDILVKGSIRLNVLSPETIYGRQIIVEREHKWLGLWLAMISRDTIKEVGLFDENFLLCGFEDADYCIRAKKRLIETKHHPFPVQHFWGKTRWGLPNYVKVRRDNIDYFEKKHGFRLGGDDLTVIHD